MKWLVLLLTLGASAQQPNAVTGYARQGNRFTLQFTEGLAELEWASSSTFRFRRAFGKQPPRLSTGMKEAVDVTVKDSPAEISFTTTYLKTTVYKNDLRLEVRRAEDDSLLMKDSTPAERREGMIAWERLTEPNAHYYGLGGKTGASLDLRGSRFENAVPFLISTAGYGLQFMAPGRYNFDIGHARQSNYRIEQQNSDHIDFYFYFGPTPKEIFEERAKAIGIKFAPQTNALNLRSLIEQSLSGVILPAETVAKAVPAEYRRRLEKYLQAYVQEAQDKGCPILHPLPVQFPRDVEADKYTDETMLGDEILLAAGPSAYLPQGIWTNLKTDASSRGRQVIRTTDAPALFARNGSIVPLTTAATLELHYFPKLGAEFFLYEEDVSDYSQVHAAPAADIMRLEIESKVARDYTWVIHHIEGVKTIGFGGASFQEVKTLDALRDRTWYNDSVHQNIYVRDRVRAGQDHIVNLTF